ASGDSNPFDDAAAAFTMNRDFKVGLVLFDEVLLFHSQQSARRLADPQLAGRAPNGVDLLPTEGAVSNALYLNPKLRLRVETPAGQLRLVLGALFARAPQPVVDPYQSLLASAPRNVFGAAAGRSYGTEVDAAVSLRLPAKKVAADLGLQAGVLFP